MIIMCYMMMIIMCYPVLLPGVDGCLSNPCLNGGSCVNGYHAQGYNCICPDAVVGPQCQFRESDK